VGPHGAPTEARRRAALGGRSLHLHDVRKRRSGWAEGGGGVGLQRDAGWPAPEAGGGGAIACVEQF
jgi:hypothetical protein